MRIRTRIIYGLLLLGLLSFAACTDGTHDETFVHNASDTESIDGEPIAEQFEAQSNAVWAYQAMMEHFPLVEDAETGDFVYAYDADYGGAYINNSNVLVICVKDLTPERKLKYVSYCGTEDIAFCDVQYSLQELQAYVSEVISLFGDSVFYGINEEENCIDVFASPGTTLPEELRNAPIRILEVRDSESREHKIQE